MFTEHLKQSFHSENIKVSDQEAENILNRFNNLDNDAFEFCRDLRRIYETGYLEKFDYDFLLDKVLNLCVACSELGDTVRDVKNTLNANHRAWINYGKLD